MSAAVRPEGDRGGAMQSDDASSRAARRLRFSKARAPVSIAMRVVAAAAAVAAAVAMNVDRSSEGARTDVREAEGPGSSRGAGFERSVRRSVFMRRAALGLDEPFALDAVFGTAHDKDLH